MDNIHEIIEELKRRDYSSFDTFYHLTKNQVFYAIVTIIKDKSLAEDLMQDTYTKFLEKIDDYKSNSNPYAYLSTIGRNLAINLYNKRKREVVSDELMGIVTSAVGMLSNEI